MQSTVDKLKNFGNGAHAHTANKTAFYLEGLAAKGRDTSKLESLANRAMELGEWRELSEYMRDWW